MNKKQELTSELRLSSSDDRQVKFNEARVHAVKQVLEKKLYEIIGNDSHRTVVSLKEDELRDLAIEMLQEFQRQMSSIIIVKEKNKKNYPIDLEDDGLPF